MFTRALLLLLCLSVTSFGQTQVQPSNAETRSSTAPAPASTANPNTAQYEYRVLATSKTSTLQNELNDAAQAGFRFEGVMGGATSFGGSEGVVVMSRNTASNDIRYEYKLLATKKTSTMQKELQEAGKEGFAYAGITVAETFFGGSELVVILRKPRS